MVVVSMPLHEKLEVFYCIFEVTTPYVTQRQEMEAPRIMLEQRFIALVEQAVAAHQPALKLQSAEMLTLLSTMILTLLPCTGQTIPTVNTTAKMFGR